MKKVAQIAVLLAITVLSSCSGGMSGLGVDGRGIAGPAGDFHELLASEYTNLAAYERDFMKDEGDAEYFTAKARRVLRRQEVEPDLPAQRTIPGFAAREVADARAKLVDALATLRGPENDALLALAQTRYDCWLAHQEDFPQENAWISCKAEFYDALALLDIPESDNVTYSVYFEPGMIELGEEAKKTVGEIADRYLDRPEWYVVLKGYTDKKGSPGQNKVLAMRRAIAVKNMLGQYGIDLNNIAISAEGEALDTEGPESRRVDIRVWPHYVGQDIEKLSILPGWQHSAEF